jgi:hypothetical protein
MYKLTLHKLKRKEPPKGLSPLPNVVSPSLFGGRGVENPIDRRIKFFFVFLDEFGHAEATGPIPVVKALIVVDPLATIIIVELVLGHCLAPV